MEVHHGKIYTPIFCGNAATSVPSFIGSKSYFGGNVCALQATFLDGFASKSNLHTSSLW